MKYFKNTELADLHKVSEKSVRNWVDAAQTGKLNLQLHEHNNKWYIANTSKNTFQIEQLVQKGKKYKNSRGFKTITPTDHFYGIYSTSQILDIISSVSVRREIPVQYGYLDGGAESWDKYANRLAGEETANIISETISMLDMSGDNLDSLTAGKRINVVDLGPGNGVPVRNTLERLIKQGRLNRYIAIDMSREMLDILEKNIRTWFGEAVKFEGYIRDFSSVRFDDILAEDYLVAELDVPTNIVFTLGGTINNFRLPSNALQTINSSLRPDDIIIYSGYLDTPYNRRYFDLSGANYDQKDPQQSGLIPSLWQIDDSLCEFVQLFNEEKRYRSKLMKPKVDILVKINLNGRELHVELPKHEPILLWRHIHYDLKGIIDLFTDNGFDLLQALKSKDQNYVLLISKIKTGV